MVCFAIVRFLSFLPETGSAISPKCNIAELVRERIKVAKFISGRGISLFFELLSSSFL